jgi:hypothetical protein
VKIIVDELPIESKPEICTIVNHEKSGRIVVNITMTTSTFLSNKQGAKLAAEICERLEG